MKSSSSSSRKLIRTFSEFDTIKATKSETADNLLYPEHEDYEYRRIRNSVICHGKLSKEDASAILLQKTFRMYRIRRVFANYYRQFQHVKKVTMRPYFIAFVLNSHASRCDRRKLYETQFSKTLFCNKLFRGFTHPPFEVFTVTDQCLLSPYIDCSVLSQFVKKVYHTLILRAFLEWRIIARKQTQEQEYRKKVDVDILKRQIFGNEYVCFNLWYRYTKRKKKRKMNSNARIPQWDYYMSLIDKKNAKYQKSLEVRRTTIKKAAIQALLNRVIAKREEENVLIEAEKFRIKRNMIFALSAWAHYIVICHNRTNTMRAILREWFCLIQQRIHFRYLLSKFAPRHSYYEKRAVFSAFMKNRQISQTTSSYLYCKLQTKPSLALYFVSILTHDDDISPFYLAMHAWTSLFRRRKKWQHFIFQDIKTSNYDDIRRRSLTALRKQNTPFLTPPSNFISPNFDQETLIMYEYVMKMKTDYETIFLLSSDEEAKEAVANSTSAAEQRRLFFKMWLGMKAESTLLMRLAAVNLQKRRAEKANEAMKQSERTLAAYQKAVTFLESYNLASEEKFNILKKAIKENNKKAVANRTRCIHRDRMIIYAHYSHYNAEALKVAKPLFITNDKLKIVAKIKQATTELTRSFQRLTNISGLGRTLEQPNTFSFSHLLGCRSPVQKFDVDHKTLQKKFASQMKKGQLSPITQIQFERLMAGYVNDTSYKGLKTYQRMDPYAAPIATKKALPNTGINYRLLKSFPMKSKKQIKIVANHKKKNTIDFSIINPNRDEEEEEEDAIIDDFDIVGITSIRRPGITNAYDKSKGSMFFNSIKSFTNIITQSSFAVFSSEPTSFEMKSNLLPVAIEEVVEEGSSDSSSDDEFERGQLRKIKNPNKKNKLVRIIEEDLDEEEEEEDLKFENANKNDNSNKNNEVEENKDVKKIASFKGFTEGFDEELMKSINSSEPPKSPNASNKVKLFLEILFGRASRNQVSIPVMNLKKRLVQELKNQKEGVPIPGIKTQETVMPIANLLELYHEDRDNEQKSRSEFILNETDDDLQEDKNKSDENNDKSSAEVCSVTYQSKRYRPLPKKERQQEHHHHHHHDESHDDIEKEEGEIEESKADQGESESSQMPQSAKGKSSRKKKESKKKGKSKRNKKNNNDSESGDYESESDIGSSCENSSRSGRKIKNKESSRRGSILGKGNKESSRSKKVKSKNKVKEEESSAKRSKKHKKNKNDSKAEKGKGKGKKEKLNENEENDEYDDSKEYSYSYSYSYSSSSSDLEDYYRERTPPSQISDSPREIVEAEEEEEEAEIEEEEKINESDIDPVHQIEELNKTARSESSEKSRLSSAASQKSHPANSTTPFTSIDEENSKQNPLSNVDKIVFSYLKKNLEEEDNLDLVDIDDEYDTSRSTKSEKKNVLQKKKKIWKPPKFTPLFNPHQSNPLTKQTNSTSSTHSLKNSSQQLIVIPQENEITPSMRKTINEESLISRILYHNGKTLIKPATNKKTSNSYTRPILSAGKKFAFSSNKDIYANNIATNIKLEKSLKERPSSAGEQVVTFGGGGRGISEESLKIQRVRAIRQKQLMKRQEGVLNNTDSSVEYEYNLAKKSDKAKEYEDLTSEFTNLRSVVTQLIQMMASSQDDSKEFEILRKRAKFLRKKPSFIGLVRPNKLTPEQFCSEVQLIYMKYMRKKNTHATADELFQLIKNNMEFAPLILKVIEKTACEERRYIDSKLQRSRLGKQPADQGMTIHFVDLDWMTTIPDYKSVTLQYKVGYDNPNNLAAIVAPTQEDKLKSRFQRGKDGRYRRRKFKFADPSRTNWDRTLENFELKDLVMISNWVPKQLMDEVISDHMKKKEKKS